MKMSPYWSLAIDLILWGKSIVPITEVSCPASLLTEKKKHTIIKHLKNTSFIILIIPTFPIEIVNIYIFNYFFNKKLYYLGFVFSSL
jgi:hypothetical protein